MKNYVTKIGFLVLVVLLVASLNAFAQEQVTLEWFALGDTSEVAAQKEVIAMFEKAYPHVKIEVTRVPNDQYYDRLKVRIASGNAPDLARVVIEEYADLAKRGALLDLTPFVEADLASNAAFQAQWDDYFSILTDALHYEDKIYGLPGDWNNAIIFYNKDLFDAAGLEYPTDDWTIDEFLEIAQALTLDTAGRGRIDQYGYMVTGDWFDCIAPWIFTFGGQILNDDWTASALTSPEAIAGLQFIDDLVNKYKVSPSPAVMEQMGGSQYFMTSRIAMAHYGRYMVPAFRSVPFDWDVVAQPKQADGTRGVPFGVAAVSALATTKHPEIAWEFIKFYSSYDAVKHFDSLGNSIPVLRSVTEEPSFKTPETAPRNQWTMIEAIEYSQLIPSPPGNNEIINVATSGVDELLLTGKSAEQVAEEVSIEINRILSE